MQNTDSQKDFVICILNNWLTLQHGLLASHDHVYCNQPQRISLVTSHNIGLSDHLPVFWSESTLAT